MINSEIRINYYEDDKQHREVISEKLTKLGYTVDVSSDGPTAIEKAVKNIPDIILADILMPGMDGLATLSNMRAKGIVAPAIILTNFDKHDIDGSDLIELNISKILLKASSPLDLVAQEIEKLKQSILKHEQQKDSQNS